MKEKSLWSEVSLPSFPRLEKDINVDTLVIGGGIAGILCAYELKKRNIDCIVIEKNRIGNGITKNTTAFITAQHETLYQDIIKMYGKEKAQEYLVLNLKAIEKYKELGLKYPIDYEECSSSLFSSSSEKIKLEKEALDLIGYIYSSVDSLPLNINFQDGITFKRQAILHPLKLIKELVKELKIYEKTEIIKLKDNTAYTDSFKINFKNVVIATHFPFINRSGFYFTKMYQRRSYVCALKYQNYQGTFCSIDENGLYFRWYQDYLIIGGNDRDTKEEYLSDFKNKVQEMFPNNKIEYYWSNQDCVTLDGIPYIGKYDNTHPSWYVISGFNLWGFSWAMASSFIIADLIEEKRKYPLVDPKRKMNKKQLFDNLGNTVKNLVTLKTPRCTHLGCALKWNGIDKVYECPCHGSRFDVNGKLIDGPAMKDLN